MVEGKLQQGSWVRKHGETAPTAHAVVKPLSLQLGTEAARPAEEARIVMSGSMPSGPGPYNSKDAQRGKRIGTQHGCALA